MVVFFSRHLSGGIISFLLVNAPSIMLEHMSLLFYLQSLYRSFVRFNIIFIFLVI